MSYSILFRQFPIDQFDVLAPLVRQTYGCPDYDARNRIRKGWGFLERDADEQKAQQIVSVLHDLVLVFDNATLRTPSDPLTMLGFASVPEGIVPRWQSPQEPERLVPWSDLAIVAAGGFSEEVIRGETKGGEGPKMGQMLIGLGVFAVTGMPSGIFGKKDKKNAKPVKATKQVTFGCLVTRQGEQFAFSPEKFDFSGLGAKKQLNTAGNFRALVAEFKERSLARLNLGARYLLENKSLTLANYQGFDDFETEVLWMMNTV